MSQTYDYVSLSNEILSIVAFILSIVSLILYVRDKRHIEPVIVQTNVRIINRVQQDRWRYQLYANITNIGSHRAENCECDVYLGGNRIGELTFQPIDSPLGRIDDEWPAERDFTVYPNTPITVRGFIVGEAGSIAQIVLSCQGKECSRSRTIRLPKSPNASP